MAMTVGQLVRSLSRELGGSIDSADESNGIYVMTVPFTDGRSQQVTVFLGSDENNDSWFVASSSFGSINDLDLTELMQRNYSHYGFASIGSADGNGTVIAQLPLEMVDVNLGKRLIIQVAAWADSLEEEFYGDDVA